MLEVFIDSDHDCIALDWKPEEEGENRTISQTRLSSPKGWPVARRCPKQYKRCRIYTTHLPPVLQISRVIIRCYEGDALTLCMYKYIPIFQSFLFNNRFSFLNIRNIPLPSRSTDCFMTLIFGIYLLNPVTIIRREFSSANGFL